MPQITFVQPDGTRHTIEVSAGTSVMHAAVSNDIPGIVAECGGSAMCATCHVYVDPACIDQLPPISDVEVEMLGSAASEQRDTSRLSCQLVADDVSSNLIVHIPLHQN